MSVINYYMIYSFVKTLTLPFDKWDAFKTGVIDKSGNIIVKKDDRDRAQKASFGPFEVLMRNLKRFLSKLPGGASTIGSFAAALYLLKEHKLFDESSMLLESEDSFYEIDLEKLGKQVVETVTASVVMADNTWMSREAQQKHRRKNAADFIR